MKKFFPIIAILIIVLGFSACTNKSGTENAASDSQSSIVDKPKQSISHREIEQNKTTWEKKTSDLKVVNNKTTISDLATFPKDLDGLKKKNDYVISGTVVNLQQMTDLNSNAMTKVTILVSRVISGDDKLTDHKITVVWHGGITKNAKSKKVFIQSKETPLPEIGSKIITGINNNTKTDLDKKYVEYLKDNHIKTSSLFKVSVPEYNVWIKNSDDKKYKLNNPTLTKKSSSIDDKDLKALNKLTTQLNNNYNN